MLVLIGGLVVANGLWPQPVLRLLAALALLGFLALELPRLPRVAHLLLVIAAGTALLSIVYLDDPAATWLEALKSGSFYTSVFVALAFLREPALRSALVRRCGLLLVNQPSGRRYLAISTGGVLFGTVLNLGAINLLGAMIRTGNSLSAAGGRQEIVDARLRRMALALLRGFSTTPMASPLSIAFIVIVSTVPGVRWPSVLALGVVTMVLVILLGWLMDWLTRPRHLASLVPPREAVPGGGLDVLRFTLLVLSIFGLAVAIELSTPLNLPMALLMAAPSAGFLWAFWQLRRAGPLRAAGLTVVRLARRGPPLLTGLRAEVSIISAATFIGIVIAAMIPGELVAEWLRGIGIGDMALVLAMVPTVAFLSALGINPILPVVVLASAMGGGGVYSGPPELLALGFLVGWSSAINISPLIPVVLTVSRVVQVPASTITLRWNLVFGVCLQVAGMGWLVMLGWLID